MADDLIDDAFDGALNKIFPKNYDEWYLKRHGDPVEIADADPTGRNADAWSEIGAFITEDGRVGPDPYDANDERNYLPAERQEESEYEPGELDAVEEDALGADGVEDQDEHVCTSCGIPLDEWYSERCPDCIGHGVWTDENGDEIDPLPDFHFVPPVPEDDDEWD